MTGVTSRRLRAIALTTLPMTIAAVACSSSGGSSAQTASSPSPTPVATTEAPAPVDSACAAVTANPAAKPPSNVPTPADATFYDKVAAGSTIDYFAYAPGNDVKKRRDAIKTQLSNAGYEIKGTDAEDNEEAELEFEGNGHIESSIQVIRRTGCETQLRLRYRIRG